MVPRLYLRKTRPKYVLDISGLKSELRYIEVKDDTVRIGALTTISDLMRSSVFNGSLEAFKMVANNFATVQVRNMATVGGNVAQPSPIEDLIPVFLTLDSEVRLLSVDGERTVPLEELYDPDTAWRTLKKPNELITEVSFRIPSGEFWSAFGKIGRRAYNNIAIVNAAVVMVLDPERRSIRDVRIALNRVGGRIPGRARLTERALINKELREDVIDTAVKELDAEYRAWSDARASREYRRLVSKVLVRRLLKYCGTNLGARWS